MPLIISDLSVLEEENDFDNDLSKWFRCSINAYAAVKEQSPELVSSAISSSGDYDSLHADIYGVSAFSTVFIANYIVCNDYVVSENTATTARKAIEAAEIAIRGSSLNIDVFRSAVVRDWELIGNDLSPFGLLGVPIWFDEPNKPKSKPLEAAIAYLSSKPELSFWARWYERMAEGRPMDWEMQKEIALIPDDDWKRGAVHVAGLISEIEARYAAAALPLAEDLEVDGDGRVYAVPVPVPEGDVYQQALEAVRDALDDALLGANHALREDDLEARVLSRTLEKYRDKPYRVHQDFTNVRDSLGAKLGDVFPDDHPPVVNLIRAVEDGAVNIRRAVPAVRETLKANAWVRLKEASDTERARILALLAEFEAIARADFAQDLAEDRAQIEAPTSEMEEKDALYRTGSRAVKLRRMVVDGTVRVSRGLIDGTALGQVIAMILRLLGL